MRLLPLVLLLAVAGAFAQNHAEHEHHKMTVDKSGVVMNENTENLPRDCEKIEAEHEFEIFAGRKYANDIPGTIFGMSETDVTVAPCSRVTVKFVNEDQIRHQWMVHGLPKYLYPAGMFHIEAMGGQTMTGTFIVPGEDKNYLIHCDMAQHMEKGMRGQLVVGSGSGDLWSVPGVSDSFYRSSYLTTRVASFVALLAFVAAFAVTWACRIRS